jgi:SAM-dependent methyltransferase
MDLLWKTRSLQPERMDLETLDPATTATLLRNLEVINRWLGGVHATLSPLRRFAKYWGKGERIRFIDWGTGGADVPRALVRWGRRQGFRFEIICVDSNPAVLEYARQASRDYPELQFRQADFMAINEESFDYALSSLCLHHLTDTQIVALLQKSNRLCQRGMIMNDLWRTHRAWLWIWILSRLGRAHPIVRHDGPLSVRRAFTPRELQRLALQAGLPYLGVSMHFGYRLVLSGEKRV